mgnify:CR=1 FL=1
MTAPAGAVKLQGLALAWGRVLDTWIDDREEGQSATMAALDKELTRGANLGWRRFEGNDCYRGPCEDRGGLTFPVAIYTHAEGCSVTGGVVYRGRTVPALVSEPDLFLRLCIAPTIGVTGTKGKTTTSALTHALLAADPSHRAILGGNIGTPLVERLWELTAFDRVVDELSELQLPTLSCGTTVGVYTNVTSDHLDRHGSLEAYRRVKRRLAELVDPDGALVLNADDPVVAAHNGLIEKIERLQKSLDRI